MNIQRQTFKMLYLLRFWQELYVTRHSITDLPFNLYMVNLSFNMKLLQTKQNKTKQNQKPASHMLNILARMPLNAVRNLR